MDLPTNGQTDRQTDRMRERRTDGKALLLRCKYTSNKAQQANDASMKHMKHI